MMASLAVAFLMLGGKTYAWLLTGSAAILSDALESVVHLFA
ncbi:MAG: cation transporter, partial [Bacteroidetes bacterium]|nr:cation transporter [Bacteroidota bacterium]